MNKFKEIIGKILKPTLINVAISVVILILIAIATVFMLSFEFRGTPWEIVAYMSFALSAIGFAYAVYIFVLGAPHIKRSLIQLVERREFTRRLLHNWGFRTILTSTFALAMSIFNSVLNAYLGISERSIWFGALSAYYIFLALMRSGLLIYHRKKRDFESGALIRAKKYMRCGILLLILNAALSSAIAQMIFDDRGFEYKDWLIYAFAAYAFYKIITSIINMFKARKQDDLTIQAIREINTVDAAVSILALQTALLHAFDDGTVDISLFNTLTGSAVSIFSLSLSIYMIIKGIKAIKEIKKTNAGK